MGLVLLFLRFCCVSFLSLLQRKKGDFGIETGLEREYEMHMQKMGWVSVGGRAWVWRRSGSLFDLFAALDCLQRAGLPSSCVHSSGRPGREQLRRVRVTKGHGKSTVGPGTFAPVPYSTLSTIIRDHAHPLFAVSFSLFLSLGANFHKSLSCH